MSQLLILSSAYCAEELVSEFGCIPPAFLPVGGKRLYELQREAFPSGEAFMSVPASYFIDQVDVVRLQELGIQTVPVQDGLPLGHAFTQCCGEMEPIATHILYGDTLVFSDDIDDVEGNTIGIGVSNENYPWHRLRSELLSEADKVLIGYIHIDDMNSFRESVLNANGDFIEGLYFHHQKRPWQFIENLRWLDFGHIHTYFQSKSSVSTARSFNEVVTNRRVTYKVSKDSAKIDAEAAWFENLPSPMRPLAATFAGRIEKGGRIGYATEFLYLNTLSDLYVFSNLSGSVWRDIFDSCQEFLTMAANFRSDQKEDNRALYQDKTLSRLERFARESSFDIEAQNTLNGRRLPSLKEIALSSSLAIKESLNQSTVIHGDFCFSNVFFDFRSRGVKVIDPRGINAKGEQILFGDQRYDVAKLHHSVIGGYDFIISGRYQISGDGNNLAFEIPFGERTIIQEYFRSLNHCGIDFGGEEIHAISIHLFLSMLPLHSDRPDRQKGFIANALRLFSELD